MDNFNEPEPEAEVESNDIDDFLNKKMEDKVDEPTQEIEESLLEKLEKKSFGYCNNYDIFYNSVAS